MDEALAAYRALGDPNRLRILCALKEGGELCACQIVALIAISGAAVSRHLALLQQAGLCLSRKEGRWVYYSLAQSPYLPLWGIIIPRLEEDRQKLKAILAQNPEDICRLQREGKNCC